MTILQPGRGLTLVFSPGPGGLAGWLGQGGHKRELPPLYLSTPGLLLLTALAPPSTSEKYPRGPSLV